MGMQPTGAYTTSGCKRIELSYLLRAGYIIKGATTSGVLSWSNSQGREQGSIKTECKYISPDPELKSSVRLIYTFTSSQGEKRNMDYKIGLYAMPSNLGRGEVLYFADPISVRLCRVLYLAYGSPYFLSREGYRDRGRRIYYPLQISSRLSKENDKYFSLEKKLKSLGEMRATDTYKGVKTRRADRIDRLRDKQEIADLKRWSPEFMPAILLKDILKDIYK